MDLSPKTDWWSRLQQRLWEPWPPHTLAIFRIVVFVCLYRQIDPVRYSHLVSRPPEMWSIPWGLQFYAKWFPLTPVIVYTMARLFKIFCLLAAVGFFTRISAGITAVLTFALLGIPEMFGKINHGSMFLFWFAAILAGSPCGDFLSVDWLIAGRGKPPLRVPPPSPAYGLPLHWGALLIGLLYFFPGWRKLMAGAPWISGDILHAVLLQKHHMGVGHTYPPIDQFPWLLQAGAVAVVVFELGFLFLVFTPLRVWVALTGITFHLLNYYFLGIDFLLLAWMYVLLFDWSRPWNWLAARFPRLPHLSMESIPPFRGGFRPLLLLGTGFAAALAYTGIRNQDGWPFGIFPAFDRHPSFIAKVYILEVDTLEGKKVIIDLQRLKEVQREYPRDRFFSFMRTIETATDPATKDALMTGLLKVGLAHHPAVKRAAHLALFESTVSLKDTRQPASPRRLLWSN